MNKIIVVLITASIAIGCSKDPDDEAKTTAEKKEHEKKFLQICRLASEIIQNVQVTQSESGYFVIRQTEEVINIPNGIKAKIALRSGYSHRGNKIVLEHAGIQINLYPNGVSLEKNKTTEWDKLISGSRGLECLE